MDWAATLPSALAGRKAATADRKSRMPAPIAAKASGGQPSLRPMSLAEQWTKVTSILVRSSEGVSAVQDMQSAATRQLDLAQYGLSNLVDELSLVMTITGRSGHRRPTRATVHTLAGSSAMQEGLAGRTRALAA